MFQKRILNAGVTAREMHSRTAMPWKVIQLRRAVPKAPLIIAPYTAIGFSPVVTVVTSAHTNSAATIAPRRIAQALYHGIAPRLEM